jgi:hypothetical protein
LSVINSASVTFFSDFFRPRGDETDFCVVFVTVFFCLDRFCDAGSLLVLNLLLFPNDHTSSTTSTVGSGTDALAFVCLDLFADAEDVSALFVAAFLRLFDGDAFAFVVTIFSLLVSVGLIFEAQKLSGKIGYPCLLEHFPMFAMEKTNTKKTIQ